MLDPKLRNNSFEFAAQTNPDPALILRTLAAAQEVDGDALAAQAPGAVVKIRGFAHPGPDGVLTAPLSGQPCVWYRSVFFPGQQYTPVPSVAPSDGPPALNDYQTRRTMNPTEEISTAPFRIGGRQDGQVSIDPVAADVDTDVLAANQRWKGRRGFSSGLMVEWILSPGAPVTATGRLGADRTLQAAPDAALFISTKGEQRIAQRDRAGASWDAHAIGARTITTQRFANRAAHVERVMQLGVWGFTALAVLAILVVVLIQLL